MIRLGAGSGPPSRAASTEMSATFPRRAKVEQVELVEEEGGGADEAAAAMLADALEKMDGLIGDYQ